VDFMLTTSACLVPRLCNPMRGVSTQSEVFRKLGYLN